MEPTSIIDPFIKRLSPIKLLDIISLLVFPMLALKKFFPDIFQELIIFIPYNLIPLWAKSLILITTKLLAAVSIMILISMSMLFLTKLIQGGLRRLFGIYSERDDSMRSSLLETLSYSYIRIVLYTTALVMYSLVIMDYTEPLAYLHSTHTYWITIFPIYIIVVLALILFILPL